MACRVAVGAGLIGEPAHQTEKTFQLRFGVVKAPSTCPAVGACEDGRVAKIRTDAAHLPCNQCERTFPTNRYKRVGASLFAAMAWF